MGWSALTGASEYSRLTVAVVGASVAGAFCSWCVSPHVHRVLMFDDRVPAEKPCGGGISPRVFSLFPELLQLSCARNEPRQLIFITSAGKEIPSRVPRAWIVSRRDFNESLLQLVLGRSNVQLIPERVVDLARDGEGYILTTRQGHCFKADILVGADGVASLVRRRIMGKLPDTCLGIAVGYMVTNTLSDRIVIQTFRDLEGYLWYFPRVDHASVGIALPAGTVPVGQLQERLEGFVGRFFPSARRLSKWRALIPHVADAGYWDNQFAGKNWALIGDAAGHVHPITGEGILYALWSANLVAKAIASGDVQSYDRLWRSAYGATLRGASIALGNMREIKAQHGYNGYELLLRGRLGD